MCSSRRLDVEAIDVSSRSISEKLCPEVSFSRLALDSSRLARDNCFNWVIALHMRDTV